MVQATLARTIESGLKTRQSVMAASTKDGFSLAPIIDCIYTCPAPAWLMHTSDRSPGENVLSGAALSERAPAE